MARSPTFGARSKPRDGETIVFSWIEWPSKQARDDAWPKLMADPRMRPDKAKQPFDAQRMIYGGFATVLDKSAEMIPPQGQFNIGFAQVAYQLHDWFSALGTGISRFSARQR